jgi:hypothetical protein
VLGILCEHQIKPFLRECDDMGFIPSQVGLEDLQSELAGYPSDDDHVWHTMCDDTFKPTEAAPTTKLTAAELLRNFRSVGGNWNVVAAVDKHGF